MPGGPGNPAWVKGGPSPNPKGSPPKERRLARMMDVELDKVRDNVTARQIIVQRAIDALTTGVLVFPAAGGPKSKPRRIKLIPREWNDLLKYVVTHLDGPARTDINITHDGNQDGKPFSLPAEIIAPHFFDTHRDVISKLHTEYLLRGGRGSIKSTFISEEIINLLKANPSMHALAMRQVANTLRDSVYAQLQWSIGELGLSDEFKCTTSPLEIEYLPTGQKIYFRGADDPGKIKSIKPAFGHIGILWLEELDQYHGPEAVRKIEQSVIRGGDDGYIFKSWNPPPTANNWANKYALIPKATQYQCLTNYLGLPQTYLDEYVKAKKDKTIQVMSLDDAIKMYAHLAVPKEWLGKVWLDEAEHLRNTNLTAFENEYLGLATNDGGMVFNNVIIRPITDEEIYGTVDEWGNRVGGFDHILHGLDWGFYPDPASYGKMHYDAARRTLYIFGEVREWKKSNEELHKCLIDSGLYSNDALLIADSAEPKSVGDFKAYGSNCRGAEKGPESVRYSMKWLQGLNAIVIDNVRAPYHADEFLNYEFERTKDGEIISEYPDKNNHAIDDTRYATNLIWRRRGE